MVNTSGKSPEAEIPEVQHAPTSSATNVDPATLKTEGVADRRAEQVARQDEMKNAARVRASLQRPMRIKNLKQHLIEYWGLEDVKEIERVQFVETCNLPPQHQKGYDFLNDNRLAGTMIAVVPDDMWIKGDQPSESNAIHDLILFKESNYKGADDIGWMTHELAHCLRFKDTEDEYSNDSQASAFEDIIKYEIIPRGELENELNQAEIYGASEEEIMSLKKLLESTDGDKIKKPIHYPNNRVEAFTFSQQFRYLKENGVARDDIKRMLSEHYDEEDFQFFDRLLDEIFKP